MVPSEHEEAVLFPLPPAVHVVCGLPMDVAAAPPKILFWRNSIIPQTENITKSPIIVHQSMSLACSNPLPSPFLLFQMNLITTAKKVSVANENRTADTFTLNIFPMLFTRFESGAKISAALTVYILVKSIASIDVDFFMFLYMCLYLILIKSISA